MTITSGTGERHSRLVMLPLICASHFPASHLDISRTERQKNERKRRLFCTLMFGLFVKVSNICQKFIKNLALVETVVHFAL